MKKFYLNGIQSLQNRGIDAIVRSTLALLKEHFGEVVVIVPSDNIEMDQRLWPDAENEGICFIEAYSPPYKKIWQFSQRNTGILLERFLWPFPFPAQHKILLQTVDIVLSIGGDNYSTEYGFPSFLIGMDQLAIKEKKPTVLWGASVGPFSDYKDLESIMARHLSTMSAITVRETLSEYYTKKNLSLENVEYFPDPAFSLKPQKVDLSSFWPQENQDSVIGFNVSPYLKRFGDKAIDSIDEIALFIEEVITNYDCSVLLIPHVIHDDLTILNEIYNRLSCYSARVVGIDDNYNSAQLKYIIGNCRYFIGARTHSTIAALSCRVPTISIAYSVKAKGINIDIFDHTDYVLDIREVTCSKLLDRFKKLSVDEIQIKTILKEKITFFNDQLKKAVCLLEKIGQGSI